MHDGNGLRIVSLLSAGTEILHGLGLGEQLVAISHECDYPSDVLHLPRITRSLVDSQRPSLEIDEQVKQLAGSGLPLYEVDREMLVQLAPDLIVTQAQCDVCAVSLKDVQRIVSEEPALQRTPVIALNPQSLADLMDDIQRVAAAAQVPERGREFVASLQSRIAKVTAITDKLSLNERPKVACIEWIDPLMIAANWTPQLVSLAGGRHGLAEAGSYSQYADWEKLFAYDPEFLLVAPCGFDLARTLSESQALLNMPQWSDISAVKSHRVFAMDGNAYVNRCGPRLVDTLEIFAHLIHPVHFPVPSGLDAPSVWRPLSPSAA